MFFDNFNRTEIYYSINAKTKDFKRIAISPKQSLFIERNVEGGLDTLIKEEKTKYLRTQKTTKFSLRFKNGIIMTVECPINTEFKGKGIDFKIHNRTINSFALISFNTYDRDFIERALNKIITFEEEL